VREVLSVAVLGDISLALALYVIIESGTDGEADKMTNGKPPSSWR
jgi:hypothetical protein